MGSRGGRRIECGRPAAMRVWGEATPLAAFDTAGKHMPLVALDSSARADSISHIVVGPEQLAADLEYGGEDVVEKAAPRFGWQLQRRGTSVLEITGAGDVFDICCDAGRMYVVVVGWSGQSAGHDKISRTGRPRNSSISTA